MRKVLAVASVGPEHKELVFKEIKKIFRKVRIPLDVLLQEETSHNQGQSIENGNVFRSYPYITLTVPNYEQHRQPLQKAYKNNVLFQKFILLISEGSDYDELILNRNEDILREQCRSWQNTVKCNFESNPMFSELEQQVNKIEKVMGGMDIRGKIAEIDAKKTFHLIQDHRKVDDDHDPKPPVCDPKIVSKKVLLKLFFGLEVGRGRGARNAGGATNNANSNSYNNYSSSEFMDYEEEKMMPEEEETQDIDIQQQQIIIEEKVEVGCRRLRGGLYSGLKGVEKRLAKRRFEQNLAPHNPYLKKTHHCEVELAGQMS